MSERDYLVSKAFRMPKLAMPGAKKKAAASAQQAAGMKAFNDFMGGPRKFEAAPVKRVTFDPPRKSILDQPKPVRRPAKTRVGTPAQYDAAGIPRRSAGSF